MRYVVLNDNLYFFEKFDVLLTVSSRNENNKRLAKEATFTTYSFSDLHSYDYKMPMPKENKNDLRTIDFSRHHVITICRNIIAGMSQK